MEMETGATALAFASESFAEMNRIAIGPNTARDLPAGLEIALVGDGLCPSACRRCYARQTC